MLAKKYHPDKTGGEKAATELFKRINEAYAVLSDPESRSRYDYNFIHPLKNSTLHFDPYLVVELNAHEIKLNEEVEISYRYAGEGRFFKKPENSQFIFTSGPLVEHKTIGVNQGSLRETTLTYTLCPLTTGLITLAPAVITVNQKEIHSNVTTIKVKDNSCFYCKKEKAGNSPYLLDLYIERESSKSKYRKKTIFNHKICIPRSDYALYYHRTGHILKIAFTTLGVLISISRGSGFIIGLCIGSLCGGLVCQLMYRMAGVKPQFYYSLNYKSVKALFAKGYQLGGDPGLGILNTKFVHLVAAMLK